MNRIATVALLALTACPGLPDDTGGDSGPGTSVVIDTMDTAPPCPEDLLEDNDVASEATVPEAMPVNAQICAGDDDWYQLELEAGCVQVVDLAFLQSDGDLDLEVYQGETRLARSASTNDNEQVRFVLAEAGAVQVLVSGFSGTENAYQLAASEDCEPCARPDDLEDDDTVATAATPSFPVSGEACPGDLDFAVAPTGSNCRLDLGLSATEDGALLDLVNPEQPLDLAATLADTSLSLRVASLEGDLTRVQSTRAAGYTLTAELSCAPDEYVCGAGTDWWGNATPAEAVLLRTDAVVTDSVCAGDDAAWWNLPTVEGCTTEVYVLTTSEQGEATAELFGAAGLISTTTTADGELVASLSHSAEQRQLKLTPEDASADYSVEARLVCQETSR